MGSRRVVEPTPRVAMTTPTATVAPTGPTARFGAIPSLDGLRAIAVLIVLVSHSGYGETVPGGLGVTIFFFLSGYLITTLILDEQTRTETINVRHFYLRRAFRLLPPLLITLAIAYTLVAAGLLGGGFSWGGLTSQLFYFANYYGIFFAHENSIPDGTGILWSLAVEEHFYIVFPRADVRLLQVRQVAEGAHRRLRGAVRGRPALAALPRVPAGLHRDPHVLRHRHPLRLHPLRLHPRPVVQPGARRLGGVAAHHHAGARLGCSSPVA